jgi:parallel beta-helix repeat protein
MNGGTVSGNTVDRSGGGVSVHSSGTFTMSGGAISGNKARDDGGGVYVAGGTFTMGGGTVYGKGAKAGSNTAKSGASLALKDSAAIAKYGNFDDILESGLATDATLVGHE